MNSFCGTSNEAKNLVVLVILSLVLSFSATGDVAAQNTLLTDDIVQVIVGNSNIANEASQSTIYDINLDGKIDVADAVALRQGSVLPLSGWVWLVSVIPDLDLNSDSASVSPSYEYALSIDQSEATVVSIDALDPTAGLLEQPDMLDCRYAVSLSIPIGTTFVVSPGGDNTLVLTSGTNSIAADSPINPTQNVLEQSWDLVLDAGALKDDALFHGTQMDTISGFLPAGQETSSQFMIRLSRFLPNTLLASPATACDQQPAEDVES